MPKERKSDNTLILFFPGVVAENKIQEQSFRDILERKQALVTKTREYVRGQVDLWRQIPFLALEASFRLNEPDQTQSAIVSGYWHFGNGKDMGDKDYDGKTCVDLETGNLLTNMSAQYIGIGKKHYYREIGYQPSPDAEVFRLIEFPQQLSAAGVIELLKNTAQNPLTDTLSHEGIAEYKEKQRETYGITPVYTRKG